MQKNDTAIGQIGCRLYKDLWNMMGRVKMQMGNQLLGNSLNILMKKRKESQSGKEHQKSICGFKKRNQPQGRCHVVVQRHPLFCSLEFACVNKMASIPTEQKL